MVTKEMLKNALTQIEQQWDLLQIHSANSRISGLWKQGIRL